MAGFLTREASSRDPSSLADFPRLLFSVAAFDGAPIKLDAIIALNGQTGKSTTFLLRHRPMACAKFDGPMGQPQGTSLDAITFGMTTL